jgi:hypothetical protein
MMRTFKKTISIAILLIMLTSLCACSGGGHSFSEIFQSNKSRTEQSEWNGGLFETPSVKYNNDLAIVAANLSEAAEDHDGTKIKNLYSSYGMDNVKTYYYTQGFVGRITGIEYTSKGGACAIGYCELKVNGAPTNILVITARGTGTLGEMTGDLFKGWVLESGHTFLNRIVWDNVYDFEEQVSECLNDFINEHPNIKTSGNLKILITGHSLGGASANMFGARMTDAIGKDEWWSKLVNKNDIYVYTFGAIKVLTSEENTAAGYENIHNIYNYYDSFGPNGNFALLNVSSPDAKFGHTELYQDEAVHYKESGVSCTNHEMKNYKHALELNKTREVLQLGCREMSDDPSKNAQPIIEEVSDFSIIGTWKSVGEVGFGQAQPGATIVFSNENCNFYSPKDKYVLYRQGETLFLECTSFIFSETLKFAVELVDNDNILIGGYSTDITTKLRRIHETSGAPEEAAMNTNTNKSIFNDIAGTTFIFSSGAGAWDTHFVIKEDGSFQGNFHDSEMGLTGDGYPGGTLFLCDFIGRFKLVEKVNDYAYKIELEYLNIVGPKEESIKDGVKIIPSDPYGLQGGKIFILYLPGSAISGLPIDYVDWVKMPNAWYDSKIPQKLPFYGLYNVEQQQGFFSAKESVSPYDEYIFSDSDTRYISESELSGLSQQDVRAAINEIYARHGRRFNDSFWQSYFNSKSWYNPKINPEDFSDSVFNKYELKNIKTLVAWEKACGWR